MQVRINALEAEVERKNKELESMHADFNARYTSLESKVIEMTQSNLCGQGPRIMNKPEAFNGTPEESLDSFIGHLELYLEHVPDSMRMNVAVSYLNGHAFDWFKVVNGTQPITSWGELKMKLHERFQPINKIKIARDKLACLEQTSSVADLNENFLKIIVDIPGISNDEVIDRYMRALNPKISIELCTTNFTSLNTLMSHALNVESLKGSFSVPNQEHVTQQMPYYAPLRRPVEEITNKKTESEPVPMDISNVAFREKQRKRREDTLNNACFYCHKPGCRVQYCPELKERKKLRLSNMELQKN